MKRDALEPEAQHRLFHALVVMGGALALSCGGMSDKRTAGGDVRSGDPDGGGGGNSGAGGPAAASGGQSANLGGMGGAASGGQAGGPGFIMLSPGGGSPSTGSNLPPIAGTGGSLGNAACAPAQWDCSASPPGCYGPVREFYYYGLPSNCACDETRPKKAADCATGERFVCRAGLYDAFADDESIVPFDCHCAQAAYCSASCNAEFGESFCLDSNEADVDLCACSVVLLK
jgi:hypothetical protein